MDNNFQTSFIPKKPLAEERIPVQGHTSIFSFFAVVIFVATLASAGGTYFYRANLQKSINSMQESLSAARNQFEPALLEQLKTTDRRLNNSRMLLSNHIAVTPIFRALEGHTLKTVQYTKFTFTTPDTPGGLVKVEMTGRARDYTAIALQSDNLSMNKNIKDPLFSSLVLEERTGTVTFDLVFNVEPDFVRFVTSLANKLEEDSLADTETEEGSLDSSTDGTTFPITDDSVVEPLQ
ncbi:MAG: hypothetical protein KBC17_02265 [Candidatus Pacebacteria bacterium]|nr:hypothetical protein [Candidatus Paceibacterota bacterium]